jgi:hypothetical protein
MSEGTGEIFLFKTVGGPFDGNVRFCDTEDPRWDWTWPLPDILPYDESGHYVKVSESELPPQPRHSVIKRGAEYEWKPLS